MIRDPDPNQFLDTTHETAIGAIYACPRQTSLAPALAVKLGSPAVHGGRGSIEPSIGTPSTHDDRRTWLAEAGPAAIRA